MALIRRSWTAEAADNWTKEDYIAMVLSVISYVGVGIGTPMAFFGWLGWLLLGVGFIAMLLMIYVIDPKMKAMSEDYETKQKEYLVELERTQRWED